MQVTAQMKLVWFSDSGKRDVSLTARPEPLAEIYRDVRLKSLSLDFVNGHRPSELQGHLIEARFSRLSHSFRLCIPSPDWNLPLIPSYRVLLFIKPNPNLFLVEIFNSAQPTVDQNTANVCHEKNQSAFLE